MYALVKRKKVLKAIMANGSHLNISKGSKESLVLQVLNEDGSPENISGGHLQFTVKRSLDDTDDDAIIRKTTRIYLASTIINDSSSEPGIKFQTKLGGSFGNNYRITTTRTSALITTLNNGATLQNGDTSMTLTDASSLKMGSILFIDDGSNFTTLMLTAAPTLPANIVTFAAISGLAAPISDGANVTELTFTASLKDGFDVVETHTGLTTGVGHSKNFVTYLLANSTRIDGLKLATSASPGNDRPINTTDSQLTGGLDPSHGIIITDGPNGFAEISLSPSDTSGLAHKNYFYDVKYWSSDGLFIDNIIATADLFTVDNVVTRN